MRNRSKKHLIWLSLVILCLTIALTGFALHNKQKAKMAEWIQHGMMKIQLDFFLFAAIVILCAITIVEFNRIIQKQKVKNDAQKMLDEFAYVVNELEEQKECIRHMSEIDALTNLYNRKQMQRYVETKCLNYRPFYVIYIDLDDFKSINDTLGTQVADELLKEIAEHLLDFCNEKTTCSRFGGDEFLILFETNQYDKMLQFVKALRLLFEEGFIVYGKLLKPKLSIGVSYYNGNYSTTDEVILQAELAMQEVKKSGKNGWILYEKKLGEKAREKNRIEKILKKAIEEKGFKVVYQPQIDLKTGKIYSYEALLRLKTLDILPQKFIPIAEETDLILEMGRIVLEETVRFLNLRKERGEELKTIAVNFSSQQMKDTGYITFLKKLLKEYEVNPKYIEIEITESVLLRNDEDAKKIFSKFNHIGVNLVLDDFGSGYASLEYLTYIPIKKIKISKDLIDGFFVEQRAEAIKSIITLVHSMGLKITVEGIEEKWQYDFLKENGCDFIQGYLFSRPVEGNRISQLEQLDFLEEVQ